MNFIFNHGFEDPFWFFSENKIEMKVPFGLIDTCNCTYTYKNIPQGQIFMLIKTVFGSAAYSAKNETSQFLILLLLSEPAILI